jgi:phage nucleotide-binding protein
MLWQIYSIVNRKLARNGRQYHLPNTVSILIYGNPGIGKTTMACSMPKPIIFDMDRGIHRALNATADVVQATSIRDINEVINSPEITKYETLIFDTIGRLLDFLMIDILEKNHLKKMRIQDYGTLKLDFESLMAVIRNKNKNVVFLAHETEEKLEVNGATTIVKRPDTGVGSAGKSLIKDLDIIGYVRTKDRRRLISFNPDDNFYAKNGYGIEDCEFQVHLSKLIEINGKTIFIEGFADAVGYDIIYDIKTTSADYEIGKYQSSLQHKIYMFCSGMKKFEYLITKIKIGDGTEGDEGKQCENTSPPKDPNIMPLDNFAELYIWRDDYEADIIEAINNFFDWLNAEINEKYREMYEEHWIVKNFKNDGHVYF